MSDTHFYRRSSADIPLDVHRMLYYVIALESPGTQILVFTHLLSLRWSRGVTAVKASLGRRIWRLMRLNLLCLTKGSC